MVLLFLSLAMVVFYANHLAHSIQIDSIAKTVEVTTLAVVEWPPVERRRVGHRSPLHRGRSRCGSTRSGYLQTDHADDLLPWQPGTA